MRVQRSEVEEIVSTGLCVTRVETSPFSTKHDSQASYNRLGYERWTSSTATGTLYNGGPAHHSKIGITSAVLWHMSRCHPTPTYPR